MPESKKTSDVRSLKAARALLRQQRPKRWSYSAYAAHGKCPLSFGLGAVLGLRKDEAPSPPMIRGTKIHKEAEYFLKDELDGLPKSLQKLKWEFIGLQKQKPIVEQFWNANPDFTPAKEYRGWLVLKADAALPPRKGVAYAFDHKTGREYDSHCEQAELTSVVTFGRYPRSERIEVEFWYIDDGDVASYRFDRSEMKHWRSKWQDLGNKVMSEKKYLATPSDDACRWCPHRTDRGGLCPEYKVLGENYRR